GLLNRLGHVFGDRYILRGRFGCTGAEREILYLARPANVPASFEAMPPPVVVDHVVGVDRDLRLKLLVEVAGRCPEGAENIIEVVMLAKLRLARGNQQFLQLFLLQVERRGVVLLK